MNTSLLNNPKYLNRLWASLNSDFECLENLFLLSDGWDFGTFAKCCRQQQISLVMHTTLGRGKGTDEHYNRTMDLILQTSKSFWLRRYDLDMGATSEQSLDLKRRIGGFYLTYFMFVKQPYKGRIKIGMSTEDLIVALQWGKRLKMGYVKNMINFIIYDLVLRDAFQFYLTVPAFGFQAEVRNYLNNSRSEIIPLTREMKDIQDEITYCGLTVVTQQSYVEYEKMKNNMMKKMDETKTANLPPICKTEDTNEEQEQEYKTYIWEDVFTTCRNYKRLATCTGGEEWTKTIDKIAAQTDKPVLTIQNLTATESIDRRMMMETRKRIERMRKKILPIKEGKTSRPYVNEGGIFGRKKEMLEGEQKEKRERGLCSGNLWTFINGQEFGKIPEELPEILPEVVVEAEADIDLDGDADADVDADVYLNDYD